LPRGPVNFHGVSPNFTNLGKVKFSGITGWRNHVNFPSQRFKASTPLRIRLEQGESSLSKCSVPGVEVGEFSARVSISTNLRGIHLTAYVSNSNEVTVALWNPTRQAIQLDGIANISCEMI